MARVPAGFTVDLELLFHWNQHATRLRPVLADDWINPQRPKPDLMEQEFQLILRYAVNEGHIRPGSQQALHRWFDSVHRMMATYRPDKDYPAEFEHQLLARSLAELHRQADWQHRRHAGRNGIPLPDLPGLSRLPRFS